MTRYLKKLWLRLVASFLFTGNFVQGFQQQGFTQFSEQDDTVSFNCEQGKKLSEVIDS